MIFGKNEQKRQQQQLETEVKAFNDELQVLCNKYKLALQPGINVTPNGIIPVLNVTRISEEKK